MKTTANKHKSDKKKMKNIMKEISDLKVQLTSIKSHQRLPKQTNNMSMGRAEDRQAIEEERKNPKKMGFGNKKRNRND